MSKYLQFVTGSELRIFYNLDIVVMVQVFCEKEIYTIIRQSCHDKHFTSFFIHLLG